MGNTPEQKELLDAMQIMIDNTLNTQVTRIYSCIITDIGINKYCTITLNGQTHSVQYYGDTPTVNQQYRLFVPFNNMAQAFIISGGDSGGGGGTDDYSQLINKPSINSIALSGNKTSSDLGLYGVGNEPNYPVSSVNGETGVVTLAKSDVGLGNVDNTADANKPISAATQAALDGKVSNARVLTDVPANANFTDTVTTVNGKTGAISKVDVVALGIPAQDTVYTHPSTHPASMITNLPTGKKVTRFTIGTSTAGWTAADCDYLCDGTADQVEIMAALNALPATGGEIVILDGTYNITAKIDVTKDNVSIRGNGNATILKRMFNSASVEGVITLTGRSGCKIANLQVDGNKTSYTNSNNYGIFSDSSSNNNTLTGNTCSNNGYGIYLSDSSNNNTFTGNTCNNNTYGIFLDSSSNNNTFTGNTCNNNTYGIFLDSSSNNTVAGNTCNNNSSSGISLSSSSNSTVTGNTCNNNVSYGIYLGSSSNNAVTGNTCNNNNHGIHLFSSSTNTVTGNTCIRGTGLSTDYTASQNTIRLGGTGNSYNLISNNNCMGKVITNGGGTGNSAYGNKYDATDDMEFGGSGGNVTYLSATAPTSPKTGDTWYQIL